MLTLRVNGRARYQRMSLDETPPDNLVFRRELVVGIQGPRTLGSHGQWRTVAHFEVSKLLFTPSDPHRLIVDPVCLDVASIALQIKRGTPKQLILVGRGRTARKKSER